MEIDAPERGPESRPGVQAQVEMYSMPGAPAIDTTGKTHNPLRGDAQQPALERSVSTTHNPVPGSIIMYRPSGEANM